MDLLSYHRANSSNLEINNGYMEQNRENVVNEEPICSGIHGILQLRLQIIVHVDLVEEHFSLLNAVAVASNRFNRAT